MDLARCGLKGAADRIYNIALQHVVIRKVGRGATVVEVLETAQREQIVPVEPDVTILDDNRVSFKIPVKRVMDLRKKLR